MARSIPSAPPMTRSGIWLISGALLFAIAVLAWAFWPVAPATRVRRPAASTAEPAGTPTAEVRPSVQNPLESPAVKPPVSQNGVHIAEAPSISAYEPLLQQNVFRPLVVPEKGSGRSRASAGTRGRSSNTGSGDGSSSTAGGSPSTPAGPQSPDTWQGWKFTGVAQLDQQTYALMDQPGKKRSRFVRPGDRLENATVTRIQPNEVTLRQADGAVVQIQRLDVMAELLRSTRSRAAPSARTQPGAAASPGAPAPVAGAAPAAPQPAAPEGTPPNIDELRERRRRLREELREFRSQERPSPDREASGEEE